MYIMFNSTQLLNGNCRPSCPRSFPPAIGAITASRQTALKAVILNLRAVARRDAFLRL
jgi:hypothetical protein